jgi:hypothetical protein
LDVSGWYENELLKKNYGFFDVCMKYLAIGPAYLPQLGMFEVVSALHISPYCDG